MASRKVEGKAREGKKERLEKKILEKQGGEKVRADEKAVEKETNVKAERESAVDMEEGLNSPANQDCKSKK
jgi:hypothetical protein